MCPFCRQTLRFNEPANAERQRIVSALPRGRRTFLRPTPCATSSRSSGSRPGCAMWGSERHHFDKIAEDCDGQPPRAQQPAPDRPPGPGARDPGARLVALAASRWVSTSGASSTSSTSRVCPTPPPTAASTSAPTSSSGPPGHRTSPARTRCLPALTAAATPGRGWPRCSPPRSSTAFDPHAWLTMILERLAAQPPHRRPHALEPSTRLNAARVGRRLAPDARPPHLPHRVGVLVADRMMPATRGGFARASVAEARAMPIFVDRTESVQSSRSLTTPGSRA